MLNARSVKIRSSHKRGTFKWTTRLIKIAKKAYVDQNKSLNDVSLLVGCSPSTVQLLMNKHGCMRSKPMHVENNKKWIRKNARKIREEYLSNKLTTSEIALKYKLRRELVAAHIKDAGYRRTLSETFKQVSVPKGKHYGARRHPVAWDNWFNVKHTFTSYAVYVNAVRKATDCVMYSWYDVVDPKSLRNTNHAYHLDHRFSLKSGYYKHTTEYGYLPRVSPIPLQLMCHPANLKIMTAQNNQLKGHRNSLSLKMLKQRIGKFERKYGKVFENGSKK